MQFLSRKTSLNGGNAVDHAAQAPSSLLPPEERYLDVRQTASRYSSSPTTLWRWAKTRPDFPSPPDGALTAQAPEQPKPGGAGWARLKTPSLTKKDVGEPDEDARGSDEEAA